MMPVRNIETRIPGGYSLENAQKLGEAVVFEENNEVKYVLISHLSSPLRIGAIGSNEEERFRNKDYIRNIYNVFVNTKASGVIEQAVKDVEVLPLQEAPEGVQTAAKKAATVLIKGAVIDAETQTQRQLGSRGNSIVTWPVTINFSNWESLGRI